MGQSTSFYVNIAQCIIPGCWSERTRRDMQGILQPVYRVGKGTTVEVPAHIQAITEWTAAKQALVDFIVKECGTKAVISGKEHSKWLMGFQGKSPNKVPVHLAPPSKTGYHRCTFCSWEDDPVEGGGGDLCWHTSPGETRIDFNYWFFVIRS